MGIPTDDGFEKKKLPSNFARVILKVDRDLIRFNKKIPQNERNTKITKLLSLLQKDLRTLEKRNCKSNGSNGKTKIYY